MSVTDTALAVVGRPTPLAVVPTDPGPGSAPAVIFTADSETSAHPALAAKAAFLAEVAAHKNVSTPVCIGIFGPSGSGKSSLLSAVLGSVKTITEGAEVAGLATPFLADMATVKVALQPGAEPATSLMHRVYLALLRSHPRLATEISHAGSDPRAAAREASDRLAEIRQRLDAEQRKLVEVSARQARVADSVLFDEGGSRVDAYARSNRGRIERSLRRFGFDRDSLTEYKELVRDASEPRSSLTRGLGWVQAFWAYRGQTRLIVVGLAFFVLAWLLGTLIDNQESLIGSIRSGSGAMGSMADWIAAHVHWLQPVKEVVELAGVVALAMNVVRAIRFLQPIATGTSLLRGDVEARRRDIDNLVALQTRRVDSLVKEAEAASVAAADAENRLAARGPDLTSQPAPLANGALAEAQGQDVARAFFAALSTAMATPSAERRTKAEALSRLVIGLDGFERATSAAAAAFLDTAHALLAHPGFVVVVAADRDHLATGLAETDPALSTARLNRMVQIPVQIGRGETRWANPDGLVRTMLEPSLAAGSASPGPSVDITRSLLDLPWQSTESAVLEALAPFAGDTPRAVKRFVNLYRVARADPQMRGADPESLAALAAALAIQSAGHPLDEEIQAAQDAAGRALRGTPLNLQRHSLPLDVARAYASM